MFDPDDRGARLVDVLDGLDKADALVLGQPAGDLVQKQHPRPRRERPGQLQPFAFQQRQGPRQHVGLGQQPCLVQDPHAVVVALPLAAVGAVGGAHQQVLEHRHAGKGMRDLVGPADSRLAAVERRQGRDVTVVVHHLTFVRLHAARNQVEHRAFSGAVGSDHAKRLAIVQVHAEVVGDSQRPVSLRHVFHAQQCGHGSSPNGSGGGEGDGRAAGKPLAGRRHPPLRRSLPCRRPWARTARSGCR